MVIKVYISGISASQEVRKRQQRVMFILESLKVNHEVVDITDPGKEEDRSFMREACTKGGKTSQLPPQIFSDQEYLGDYEDFEVATENEGLALFLRLSHLASEVKLNNTANKETTQEEGSEDANQQNEGEPAILVNGNHKEPSPDTGDQGNQAVDGQEGGGGEGAQVQGDEQTGTTGDVPNDEEEEEEEEE